jgi:hypothetical protein
MRTILASLFLIAACGSSAKTPDAAASAIDAATTIDAAATADAAPAGTALTVKNYLSWCSVSVNGGAASSGATQTVNVTPGPITLVATAASTTFKLGPNMWHHVDGTTGNTGVPGTVAGAMSTATITVGATAACAWVCCPFANGTGCPDTLPDQCP